MSKAKLATSLIGRSWMYSPNHDVFPSGQSHLAGATGEIVAAWLDNDAEIRLQIRFDDEEDMLLFGTTREESLGITSPTWTDFGPKATIGPPIPPPVQDVRIVNVDVPDGVVLPVWIDGPE